MWILSLVPFFLQAIAIGIDEAYFHVRRGLPKWERIGHPIDTFSVLICLGFVVMVPFSSQTLTVYCILAAFSCFLVTKDEFVHKEHCPAAENWLHAILFTLHPITLICSGFMWPVIQGVDVAPWIANWLSEPSYLEGFLKIQFSLMSVFLIYQIIFWNLLWKNKPVLKQ